MEIEEFVESLTHTCPHGEDQSEDCHCMVILQDNEGFFALVVASCDKGCKPRVYSPWHEPTAEAAKERAERELVGARLALAAMKARENLN